MSDFTSDPDLNITIQRAISDAVADERAKGIADAIAAIVFEPGKQYVVLVAADAIDAETLRNLPPGPPESDCTFVFVYPIPGRAVWESACRMEIKPGNVIFVEAGCISEHVSIDGVKFVRVNVPTGKKLRDIISEPQKPYAWKYTLEEWQAEDSRIRAEERERCAKIADESARVAGITDTAGMVTKSIAAKIRREG
jgi:hypothetical protein